MGNVKSPIHHHQNQKCRFRRSSSEMKQKLYWDFRGFRVLQYLCGFRFRVLTPQTPTWLIQNRKTGKNHQTNVLLYFCYDLVTTSLVLVQQC